MTSQTEDDKQAERERHAALAKAVRADAKKAAADTMADWKRPWPKP